MQPSRSKLAALIVSSVVTALAVWLVLERAHRPEPAELHRAHFADAPLAPRPDGAPEAGVHPFDATHPIFPPSTFRRWPLTPEEVRGLLLARDEFVEYDPFDYFRYLPHLDREVPMPEHPLGAWRLRTNALGLRKDVEVLEQQPDLRILVTGDSHTDGVCNNSESFTNVLEALLAAAHPTASVEALNAGKGAYSFYNYLGVLERLLPLRPDVFVVAVYGGNDFVETLPLYHAFQHGAPPANSAAYDARVVAGQAECGACFAQQYFESAYFQEHPDQIEFALQAARDVTTEIQLTCMRQGVRPLFVYIPPPFEHEADRAAHAETLARLRTALAITPESDRVASRLADSWIAFLRDRGLDFVDLRPVFAARAEQLYWNKDHHANLTAHRVIAESLLPVIERIRPAQAERVRQPPQPPNQARALASLSSPGQPEPDSVLRELRDFPNALDQPTIALVHTDRYEPPQLDAVAAARWFPLDERHVFASRSWLRLAPNLDFEVAGAAPQLPAWRLRTNSRGMHADREPAAEQPDLRVLFVGDEQLLGACAASETSPGRLESRLRARHPARRIECLNGACDGHGLHNFLGVLEECAELKPDLLVVAVSGGRAFEDALRIERGARGSSSDVEVDLDPRLERVRAIDPAACEQFGRSLQRFRGSAAETLAAVQIAGDITDELHRRCTALGCDLLVLYVPPVIDVENEGVGAVVRAHLEPLGLTVKELQATRRIAREYLAYLRQGGIAELDITSTFQDVAGAEYGADYLVDGAGSRLIAERVALWIEHRGRWLGE